MWDDHGSQSCAPWSETVQVIPDEAVHVELLWHTPNDPDESDEGPEAGSDLDLHLVDTQYATGPDIDQDGAPDGYFDSVYDCFWFNPHPNWSAFDPSIDDDPGLDRDDSDGAGPENLNLNIPSATTYKVGVHYWKANGFDEAFATIRIYIFGTLVFEMVDVQLNHWDLWEVATIEWPSAKVTAILNGDDHKIVPDYKNPYFFQP